MTHSWSFVFCAKDMAQEEKEKKKKDLTFYWTELQEMVSRHKNELWDATDYWCEIDGKNRAFPDLYKEEFPNKKRLEEVLDAINMEYDSGLRKWMGGIIDRERKMRYLVTVINGLISDLKLATSSDWLKEPCGSPNVGEEEQEEEKEEEEEARPVV